MFKNLKLGMKLGLGFGLFILILCGLGLMAIVQMRSAAGGADRLSTEYVPEVAVANALERNSLLLMYNMRGYALSEKEAYYEAVQKNLAETRAKLAEAETLAGKHPDLVGLKEDAAKAEAAVTEYGRLIDETRSLVTGIGSNRKTMIKVGADFLAAAGPLLASQYELIRKEIAGGASQEQLLARLGNIALMHEIVDLGYDARLNNLKSETTGDLSALKLAQDSFAKVETQAVKIDTAGLAKENLDRIEAMRAAAKAYKETMGGFLAAKQQLSATAPAREKAGETLLAVAEVTVQAGIDSTQKIADASAAGLGTASTVFISGLAVAVLIGIVLALILTRGIAGPIRKGAAFASSVAAGNLDQTLAIDQDDEVGQLAGAMNTMVTSLKQKIAEAEGQQRAAKSAAAEAEKAMQEAKRQEEQVSALLSTMQRISNQAEAISERVSSASEELAAQIEQASRGTEVQRERMTETATAMEEMNATVVEVARNASEAARNSDTARTEADSGAAVVGQSVAAIGEVQTVAHELQANMRALGKQAEAIGTVMNVISDIADQTNLLALNAAIEAARAGEAGRGFAVVADEVRKLAEKTMGATKEVGQNIRDIQEAARLNLANVERAASAVDRATQLAGKSGEALTRIVGLVGDSAKQVEGIATASEEQSSASEEISRAVDEVNRIVGETAEGMVQSAKAVQELAAMSAELRTLMTELVKAG
jgi:methyl-accepting chemotaxis protein